MKRVQWVCKSNQIIFDGLLKKKEESDPKVDRKGREGETFRDTIARAQEKGVKSENEGDNLVSPLCRLHGRGGSDHSA